MPGAIRFKWIILGLVLCASFARRARCADDRYPLQGLTPPQWSGRLVSIPGAPLPAVPEESVRDAIKVYEPILTSLRVFGRRAFVARGLGYLATLYFAIGESSKAEKFFQEAQAILVERAAYRDLGWLQNNRGLVRLDRKSTRLNSSHVAISYAVFCLKKKKQQMS